MICNVLQLLCFPSFDELIFLPKADIPELGSGLAVCGVRPHIISRAVFGVECDDGFTPFFVSEFYSIPVDVECFGVALPLFDSWIGDLGAFFVSDSGVDVSGSGDGEFKGVGEAPEHGFGDDSPVAEIGAEPEVGKCFEIVCGIERLVEKSSPVGFKIDFERYVFGEFDKGAEEVESLLVIHVGLSDMDGTGDGTSILGFGKVALELFGRIARDHRKIFQVMLLGEGLDFEVGFDPVFPSVVVCGLDFGEDFIGCATHSPSCFVGFDLHGVDGLSMPEKLQ